MVFAFCADQADLSRANAIVDTRAGIALGWRVMWSAGYGFDPSIIKPI